MITMMMGVVVSSFNAYNETGLKGGHQAGGGGNAGGGT